MTAITYGAPILRTVARTAFERFDYGVLIDLPEERVGRHRLPPFLRQVQPYDLLPPAYYYVFGPSREEVMLFSDAHNVALAAHLRARTERATERIFPQHIIDVYANQLRGQANRARSTPSTFLAPQGH